MPEGIDAVALCQSLPRRPRGRALLVLTEEVGDQAPWAEALERKTGAAPLDVLARFAEDPALAARLECFGVDELLAWAREAGDAPCVILYHLEFLRAVWPGDWQRTLRSRMEMWQQRPALILVTQASPDLEKLEFKRFPDLDFIVHLRDTYKLP